MYAAVSLRVSGLDKEFKVPFPLQIKIITCFKLLPLLFLCRKIRDFLKKKERERDLSKIFPLYSDRTTCSDSQNNLICRCSIVSLRWATTKCREYRSKLNTWLKLGDDVGVYNSFFFITQSTQNKLNVSTVKSLFITLTQITSFQIYELFSHSASAPTKSLCVCAPFCTLWHNVVRTV